MHFIDVMCYIFLPVLNVYIFILSVLEKFSKKLD